MSFMFPHFLFESPQPAGRKITAGFTYLQRIGKNANYDVWFPPALKAAWAAQGAALKAGDFPAQWAAVREFNLFQESGNHKIYDLDPMNLNRAMLDLSRGMRAGGYRLTVATVGGYEACAGTDELEILDQRLHERIAQLIHMLYLEAASDEANAANDARLASRVWGYKADLPYVGKTLGEGVVFGTTPARRPRLAQARQFFEILDALPCAHILHDTAVGLQLPELNGENQWNYIASPEETLAAFNRVLGDLFDKFNGISLGRLHGRADATDEVKASTFHLRGHGDHGLAAAVPFYRQAALALG